MKTRQPLIEYLLKWPNFSRNRNAQHKTVSYKLKKSIWYPKTTFISLETDAPKRLEKNEEDYSP